MSITQDTINEGLGLIKILAGEDHKYHARIVSDLIKEIKALDKAWLNAEGKIQDLGFIPTVEKYLNNMVLQDWMGGSVKTSQRTKVKHISFHNGD